MNFRTLRNILSVGLGFISLQQFSVFDVAKAATSPMPIPRFSISHMDPSVSPSDDFYLYATGNWIKKNPVPADKSRWSGFEELQERNWQLIRGLLEASSQHIQPEDTTARGLVGNFYRSAMDTNLIESLGFAPIRGDLSAIESVSNSKELFKVLAQLHERGSSGFFNAGVSPNAKNSSFYSMLVSQGGLGLPDRDYYLKDDFAQQRKDYLVHIAKMLVMLGEPLNDADKKAALVLELETSLAKAGRSRVELRDPNKNYNSFKLPDFAAQHPASGWAVYFQTLGIDSLPELIVGQPEFFKTLDQLLKDRPLSEWKSYLKWHLLRSAAPYLHQLAQAESFAFYGTKLRGQPMQEPRWQRAARIIDGSIGEAMGQLYVAEHFPPAAKARMGELIQNLREVFANRLKTVDWMSDTTRAKALAKFDRFTQKIGHPDSFRDYSAVSIKADDFYGNIKRSYLFESRREIARVGKKVDTSEWHMTPQTVNAYFNPLQNEIVFPAGILQPPFFDLEADDPINYGAIGVVIGHEITHGYDDKGRQYDADGNLNEWWTDADSKAFSARAQRVVNQYADYEALPNTKVNGQLTLGENIADLGGASIAFEALQRALNKHPAKRKAIDGFTPEQRFFLSLTQLWRTNWREAELRRRLVVDVHAPGQFRAIGAHVNMPEFFEAFSIKEGTKMWRSPALRAKIW